MQIVSKTIEFPLYLGVFILTFGVGVYVDIAPTWFAIRQARAQVVELAQQFKTEVDLVQHQDEIKNQTQHLQDIIAPYLRVDNKSAVKAEWLADILHLGELNGLLIESLQSSDWQKLAGFHALTLHVTALGHFPQLVEFIVDVAQNILPMLLTDFSIRTDAAGLEHIDLQLMGFYYPVTAQEFVPTQELLRENYKLQHDARDPFQWFNAATISLTDYPDESPTLLQSVSLRQLTLAGYVHNEEQFWALVKLPNGKTSALHKGDCVAMEKACVTALNEQEVVLKVAAREIRMQYSNKDFI